MNLIGNSSSVLAIVLLLISVVAGDSLAQKKNGPIIIQNSPVLRAKIYDKKTPCDTSCGPKWEIGRWTIDSFIIPYPKAARAANLGGVVEVSYGIRGDSSLGDIRIEQADYPELTEGLVALLSSAKSDALVTYESRNRLHLFFDPNHQDRPIVIMRGSQRLE